MMKIFPAIDLIDGKCVRLVQGDFRQQITYDDNPLDVAKSFEDAGFTHLHLVDLQGAREGKVVHLNILEKISFGTGLNIDFGGGIKSDADAANIFNAGAKQINVGSIAVKNKQLVLKWLQKYGSEKIILSADVNNEIIAINGWEEKTEINIMDFIKEFSDAGVSYVTCTDISKDGLLQGPAFDLYKKIQMQFPLLNLIASGGVSSIADVKQLAQTNIYGVVIGKAFYEGRIKSDELKSFSNVN
ncbi:1-(5-phosphoribosyl)-5-[(5-phosphoribosylamino)methylideneamino]imidazole-4-carboxamide isomerase [soil metagenome]